MQNNAKKAFTLVELIVVTGIISLLMAILMPALNRAREQARGVLCLTKIRQLGIASYTYANNYNDYYPIAYRYENAESIFTAYAWDFTSIKNWATLPLDCGSAANPPLFRLVRDCTSLTQGQ